MHFLSVIFQWNAIITFQVIQPDMIVNFESFSEPGGVKVSQLECTKVDTLQNGKKDGQLIIA